MSFINEDFLLQTKTARRLYNDVAQAQPIVDYHNHLPPQDIASNRRFADLYELWLEGDHYKWRAMRALGVEERLITGDATNYEKFLAYARVTPGTLRNPLFHWNHLELLRYFGISETLNETNAPRIWEIANEQLAQDSMRAQSILQQFNVVALCTTDDPADALTHHETIVRQNAETNFGTKVYPTFRPDKAMLVTHPEVWNAWTERLAQTANVQIDTFADFVAALQKRHDDFHAIGGRLSDHGLSYAFADDCTEGEATTIFDAARQGTPATGDEHARFAAYLMRLFGKMDARRGWTKQLHLGALRNTRTKMFQSIGADTGFDTIGDWAQGRPLAAYLDALDRDGTLPQVILYNNNPNDNTIFAGIAGSFGDKVRFGAAWWFADTKGGMEAQINVLSNVGVLANFVGMLTDSRSFASFPRHEYFRRVLCNLLGREIESGLIPADDALIVPLVEKMCFTNARDFLGLAL